LLTGPDVDQISAVAVEPAQPGFGSFAVAACARAMDLAKGFSDACGHRAGATDVDDGVVFEQAPDVVLQLLEAILHIRSWLAGEPRVSRRYLHDASAGGFAELVGVEQVVLRVTTAVHEQSRTDAGACIAHSGALLQEAPE